MAVNDERVSVVGIPASSAWRYDEEHAARDLLGEQRERVAVAHGWVPGDFVSALLRAMYRADATSLSLLSIGFPAHAAAVDTWKNDPEGYAKLHGIAGWEPGR